MAIKRITSDDATHPTIDKPPTKLPEWAIVREINFKEDGNKLRIFFSQYEKDVLVSDYGSFEDLLKQVCGAWPFKYKSESKPAEPCANALSLKNDRLSYVIYKLADRSWQFAQNGRPIRIGDDAHAAKAYYRAHRVDPQGKADMGDDPDEEKPGCMVAYMIADGVLAKASGDAKGHYIHPINLYVDLVFPGTDPKLMPIIIDPDVRFPGGSVA